jgi:hypothetical protein
MKHVIMHVTVTVDHLSHLHFTTCSTSFCWKSGPKMDTETPFAMFFHNKTFSIHLSAHYSVYLTVPHHAVSQNVVCCMEL